MWVGFDESNLKTALLESHFYFLICRIIFGTCQNWKKKYIGPSRSKFENNDFFKPLRIYMYLNITDLIPRASTFNWPATGGIWELDWFEKTGR